DLPFNAEVVFQIKSPRGRPLIRLLRNGVVLVAEKAASLSYRAVEPGLYRVEVYHCPLIGRPRPWIYSNPIWLTAVQADD
ncbi:MAG TPA: hypothetical protein VLH18_08660, partial [Candidatus Limnocylindrales bacterium]|nr:hypothetical protein [Candidatus Limnocylindrales bacterium]